MAIFYDQTNKLFHLKTSKISYYLLINEIGMLQHVYFGKSLDEMHIDSLLDLGEDWSRYYLDAKTKEEKTYQNVYVNHSLFEIPSFGYSDKRVSSIKLESKCDNKTDFRYVSHKIYQGKPSILNQPTFRNNFSDATTVEFTLKDITKDIYLLLAYTIYENDCIVLRNTKLINNSEDSVYLTKASSVVLDIPRKDLLLTHFPGDWCHERQIREDLLSEGCKRISSNTGRSSHEHNPFFFLSDKTTTENDGDVYGFSLVYSGSFMADFEVNKWGQTRVSIGINDEEFKFEIKPTATFDFPEGLIAYSANGFGDLSRELHDIIRKNLIKIPSMEIKEEILLNSWEGCYFDFDTDKMLSYIKKAKTMGVELFVLDDGWFVNRDDDTSGLGDWYVNEKKIDLKKVIDLCHELKMRFGLWIEPEMINQKSKLYTNHPEYAVGNPNVDRYLSRHQMPLDLCNKQAVDDVYKMIANILDNYEIDYVKWDHNRTIDFGHSQCLENRQGEFYHRMVLGYYDLAKRLTENYPNILFHGCASGGGRFDLASLYYFPEIWTSDETDPIQRLFIQYGTSYMYPLITMGAHVSKNPMTSYLTKAHIALFGTYGFEFDPNKLKENEIEELMKVNDIFHKYHQEVISEGDLYRLYSPFKSNYFSMCSVSKDKCTALVLFMNMIKETRQYRFLKLAGLADEKLYRNDYDNQVYSGKYYKEIGINLTRWLDEFTSILVVLEEV